MEIGRIELIKSIREGLHRQERRNTLKAALIYIELMITFGVLIQTRAGYYSPGPLFKEEE